MAAFSISTIDGTPKRSVARRSMLRICAAFRIFMTRCLLSFDVSLQIVGRVDVEMLGEQGHGAAESRRCAPSVVASTVDVPQAMS